MAFENCSFKPSGRLLESVSNGRSRWMVTSLAIARQDPAYRTAHSSLCEMRNMKVLALKAGTFFFCDSRVALEISVFNSFSTSLSHLNPCGKTNSDELHRKSLLHLPVLHRQKGKTAAAFACRPEICRWQELDQESQ